MGVFWRPEDDEREILAMTMRPHRDATIATKFLADILLGQPGLPRSGTWLMD